MWIEYIRLNLITKNLVNLGLKILSRRKWDEIELFKIVSRNNTKSIGLWHICCLFAGLKILGSFWYREGAVDFFYKRNSKLFVQIFIKIV